MKLPQSASPGVGVDDAAPPLYVSPSLIAGCINEHPMSGILIQTVRSKAAEWRVPWAVIYVETPEHYDLSEEHKEDIIHVLGRAKQMGARIFHVVSSSVGKGLLEFAQKNAVSDMFIGSSWKDETPILNYFSLAGELKKHRNLFKLHQVQLEWKMKGDMSGLIQKIETDFSRIKWRSYGYSLLTVAAATAVCELLYRIIPRALPGPHMIYNLSMIFMLASMNNALRYGALPGLFSAFISAIIINFAYVPPRFVMQLGSIQESFNLLLFVIVTIIAARIGGISHQNARLSRKREERIQTLYLLNKVIADNRNPKELQEALVRELDRILETTSVIFTSALFSNQTDLEDYLSRKNFKQEDIIALEHCWKNQEPSGRGSFHSGSSRYHFEPMMASSKIIGVLGIKMQAEMRSDISYIRFMSVLADQSALALERAELIYEMEESRVQQEREKLRSSLLSSISHDLKTPLASVIGALSAVRHMGDSLSADARVTLISTALEEAERLNNFITNILNMTRLESGAIRVRKIWLEPDSLISDLLKRTQQRFANHKMIHKPAPVPFQVEVDTGLFEQLFYNLVDNAAKYSPAGSEIVLSSEIEENDGALSWRFTVTDQGPGIEEKDRIRVFNKFTRLEKKDSQTAGTGLGLAICKAVVDLHNGNISVNAPSKDGTFTDGAVFTVKLPGRYAKRFQEIQKIAVGESAGKGR